VSALQEPSAAAAADRLMLDGHGPGDQVGLKMTRRLAVTLVLSASLIPALASAAPRVPVSAPSPTWAKGAPAEPACGGPKKPDEGPQPPKEPPKT